MARWTCLLLLVLGTISLTSALNDGSQRKDVMMARVQSCSGWRLNKLPEVKRFIKRDLELFHNVEFKNKPGASPELHLLDMDGQLVEAIDLAPLDQKGCNELLIKKGFFKKEHMATKVPKEYKKGPYVPIEDKPDEKPEENKHHDEL